MGHERKRGLRISQYLFLLKIIIAFTYIQEYNNNDNVVVVTSWLWYIYMILTEDGYVHVREVYYTLVDGSNFKLY